MKEKSYLFCKIDSKTNPRLIPATDEDMNWMLGLGDGETVEVRADDTRSLSRHNRFMKMLREVVNHLPEDLSMMYPTPERLLFELKIQLGLCEYHISLDGRDYWAVTGSISFDKMGEAAFKVFVKDCKDVLLRKFLVYVSPEDFDENFMKLIFE